MGEIERLRKEQQERIRALSTLMDKVSRLDKAMAAIKGEHLTVFKSVRKSDNALTIKKMVLDVLSKKPKGLVALEILKLINETFDKSYERTSLSPQLTRLAKENKIHRVTKTWIYGPAQQEEDKKKTAVLPTPPSSEGQ